MDLTVETMPLGKMLLIILGTLIAGNVLVILIQSFLPAISMSLSIGIVFAMVASMSAGGSAATAVGRPQVAREKLSFAGLATVASIALTAAVLWGLFALNGVPF